MCTAVLGEGVVKTWTSASLRTGEEADGNSLDRRGPGKISLPSMVSGEDAEITKGHAPMRITFVHPHFTYPGGAGRVVLEFPVRLQEAGHDVTVISQRQNSDVVGDYARVSFVQIPGPLPSRLLHYPFEPAIILRIAKTLYSQAPDVVVRHGFPS